MVHTSFTAQALWLAHYYYKDYNLDDKCKDLKYDKSNN